MDIGLIRPCEESEALEILRDPTVLPFLSVYPVGIKDVEVWKVGPALGVVIPHGVEAEVHIACRYRDRVRLREVLLGAIKWLLARGFQTIWTTAPDNRKALVNMLKSLGFEKVGERWVWA